MLSLILGCSFASSQCWRSNPVADSRGGGEPAAPPFYPSPVVLDSHKTFETAGL